MTWKEKYSCALKEEMTIKDIMKIRDCGHPRAAEIRNKCIEYAVVNNIVITGRTVPTEIVFIVTGRDLDYYYRQMINESKCLD